jgi:hypothetical protein
VKAKIGLISLGGMLLVSAVVLVAAQRDEMLQVLADSGAAQVPDQVVPGAGSPPASSGVPEENADKAAEGVDGQMADVAQPPEILVADFSNQDRALAERVEARWKAMVERDLASAYGYTLPSFRQANTLEQFSKGYGRAVTWRKAKVLGIWYDAPEIARVKIALETEQGTPWGGQPEKRVTRIDETWLNRDGVWWLNPK